MKKRIFHGGFLAVVVFFVVGLAARAEGRQEENKGPEKEDLASFAGNWTGWFGRETS